MCRKFTSSVIPTPTCSYRLLFLNGIHHNPYHCNQQITKYQLLRECDSIKPSNRQSFTRG